MYGVGPQFFKYTL